MTILFISLAMTVIPLFATNALYDITQSFEYNYTHGPFINNPAAPLHPRQVADKSHWRSLLGYPIASPIGIAACAIMTSKGIAPMAQRNFDIFTYKTVCSRAISGHCHPNICYVSCDRQLTCADIGATFYATSSMPEQPDTLAISNSLGNPCGDPAWVAYDIAQARAALHEGQVLIVSVFGYGQTMQEIAQDFATTAQLAYQAGAQIVELNLSCPNVTHGLFYKDPAMVHTIVQCVYSAISIPVIIKVGLFDSIEQMRQVLHSAAQAGARGVCGINTVPVKIVTQDDLPFFGPNRTISGLSGAPIYNLAKQFIIDARTIINQGKLDLILLATGGITKREQFQEFLDLGADIALSATGAMWDLLEIT